ncbi:MAG TPA: type IV pilus secretin PilQ [Terriglobia bacterium]|nr:type IV pilus secretin PilQ [Terriglobia bacterium]
MKVLQHHRRTFTRVVVALISLAIAQRFGPLNRGRLLAASAPAQAAAANSKASALPPSYTGERISLNLKDVDLKDFFRLIHEVSKLNIIVDPSVSGTLTLVLDNVPWDQALDIVLKNNSLDKVLEGNVLRIAKIQTLSDEAANQAKLAEVQTDAAPLVTVVRCLRYANAGDTRLNNVTVAQTGGGTGGGVTAATMIQGVATILKSMGPTILSARGSITADARDNAVVITDIASRIPIIEGVIDELDRKSKQVSIEARIVLTTNDVIHQLQSALSLQLRNKSNSVATSGLTGTGSTSATGAPPNIVTGFGAFTISNLGGLYALNAALAAAETKNLAKTISAPTIVTQNNVPGLVQQGTELFIQTTVNNTVTSAPVNASLALAVTPQITDDGHIFLNIQVQNDSPGPVVAGNPEINLQSATTQVLVPDGGVVVFGGIKVNSNTNSVTQIPGLGRIPLFGNLFKSTLREDQVNELLFIVSPKILPT